MRKAGDVSTEEASPSGEDINPVGYVLLSMCMLSIGIGGSALWTIMPPLARELGISEDQVSVIYSLPAITWALTSPYWGRKSDIWGRKPILILGIGVYTISYAGFGVAAELGLAGMLSVGAVFWCLLGLRIFFTLISSGSIPAAQAYVAERTSVAERTKSLATLGAASGAGNILGPAVGGLLAAVSLLMPFYATGILGVLTVIAVWLFLPEKRAQAPGLQVGAPQVVAKKPARVTPLDPRILPFVAIGFFSNLITATVGMTISFYTMDGMGFAPTTAAWWAGFALTMSAGSAMFVQLVLIRALDLQAPQLLRLGPGILLVAQLGIIFAPNIWFLLLAMGVSGFGSGFLMSGVTAGASLAVSRDEQGVVAGVLGSVTVVGNAIAPWVGLGIYQYIHTGPYILNAFLACGVIALVFMRPRARQPASGSD